MRHVTHQLKRFSPDGRMKNRSRGLGLLKLSKCLTTLLREVKWHILSWQVGRGVRYLTKVFNEVMIEASISKERPHIFHTGGRGKINNQINLSLIYFNSISRNNVA